jgi:uncharacterized cupredoxin-like copper-binding protein
LIVALSASAAQAATIVKVELQDPSNGPAVKSMEMKPDRTSAPAGHVTFQVHNASTSLIHEMIVVKTDAPPSALPYDKKKNEVDEDKIKSLGEVSELPPGKSGNLSLDLKPGAYLLFCNQAGHLQGGMWTRFEVTAH